MQRATFIDKVPAFVDKVAIKQAATTAFVVKVAAPQEVLFCILAAASSLLGSRNRYRVAG